MIDNLHYLTKIQCEILGNQFRTVLNAYNKCSDLGDLENELFNHTQCRSPLITNTLFKLLDNYFLRSYKALIYVK
jgi:hypothetical protein